MRPLSLADASTPRVPLMAVGTESLAVTGRRSTGATRLVSLDVFRGMTMAAMVLVNTPGDWSNIYGPLQHAHWHGWTSADLIFPFFLFIVGVSITLSRRSASTTSIITRGAIIFVLGLFLTGLPRFDLHSWRIPGVLQRIAICYTVAALAYRWARRRSTTGQPAAAVTFSARPVVPLVLVITVLLIGYWAVMMLLPAPGGPAGDLSVHGNLASRVDRLLMPGHLWKPAWDPEGLLSTIPAIATSLLGVVAGVWIAHTPTADWPSNAAAGALAGVGVIAIALGLIWSFAFPINKNLWTSSFVMFTGGAAAVALALSYWVIDVKRYRWWTKPFVILGVNALALYVLSAIVPRVLGRIPMPADAGRPNLHMWIIATIAPMTSPKAASLAYALLNLVVLFFLLWWMYRRRIFLRA